jgi:hypothetical protein
MLQFPAFMTQYSWSSRTIPTSFLLPYQWPQPHSEDLLLAMEESDFEEKVPLNQTLFFFFFFFGVPNFLSAFEVVIKHLPSGFCKIYQKLHTHDFCHRSNGRGL